MLAVYTHIYKSMQVYMLAAHVDTHKYACGTGYMLVVYIDAFMLAVYTF